MDNGCCNDVFGRERPLWAPWRLDYIVGPKADACFLCEKAQGSEVEDHVLTRGKYAYVVLNAYPYNSGHVLVAPYRHTASLTDLNEHELAELMARVIVSNENVAAEVADFRKKYSVMRYTLPLQKSIALAAEAMESAFPTGEYAKLFAKNLRGAGPNI